MLKLKALDQGYQTKHYDILEARFKTQSGAKIAALGNKPFDAVLIAHLRASLRTILLGTPAELESFAVGVVAAYPVFSAYAEKHIKPKGVVHEESKNTLDVIKASFDYTWFSNQKEGWGAYALVKAYGLRICPYCQAAHINFHMEPSLAKGQAGLEMRPPLDHYLPKGKYPYLAVSLNNLIPSCSQCNSGVKSTGDPCGRNLAHPLDSTPVPVKFSIAGTPPRAIKNNLGADDVVLALKGSSVPAQMHIDELRLQERYRWYRHEIMDLIDRHDEHKALDPVLQPFVLRELYVLGFLNARAEDRALGICLRDVYKELPP